MTQIGHVPEIQAVKRQLSELKQRGMVQEWEIPYEDILTRLTAAIFFLTPTESSNLSKIWQELELEGNAVLRYRINEEKKLSQLEWRVEFNEASAGR